MAEVVFSAVWAEVCAEVFGVFKAAVCVADGGILGVFKGVVCFLGTENQIAFSVLDFFPVGAINAVRKVIVSCAGKVDRIGDCASIVLA